MPIRIFTTGRMRKADYSPATQQLTLHFEGGTVRAYKQVPEEVFRRLCSAPNPATYWEDRIAEEYPKALPGGSAAQGSGATSGSGARAWGDLFGGAGDDPGETGRPAGDTKTG